MKHLDLQNIAYAVYGSLAAAMVFATAYLASPGFGRFARNLMSGAWLYLTNTRG